MSKRPVTFQPEHDLGDDWESRVQQTARAFSYPPTPDLAAQVIVPAPRRPVRRRRVAAAALLALLLLGMLLSVPQVRAGVRQLLRIGGITILGEDRPASPAPLPPLSIPGRTALRLAGETTLEAAQAQVSFPILLPAYPADLGAPDHVYRQDLGGPVIVLVWVDPQQPERARLSLHELGRGVAATKGTPTRLEETTVNGLPAVWTTGPYVLAFQYPSSGRIIHDLYRLVEGSVLIWAQEGITYRLEGAASLDEAVRIAESLRPPA